MRALGFLVALAACHHPAAVRPAPSEPARFAVPADVGTLVVDAAAFADFARAARPQLAPRAGEPLPETIDRIFLLALLDALDAHWPEAVAGLDRIAALHDDPVPKAMTGLTIRIWADAHAAGGDHAAVLASVDRHLAALPMPAATSELQMLRTMAQVFTPDVCRELVATEVGPHVHAGTVALADARTIAFQRYAVLHLVPIAADLDAALGRLGIAPLQ